MARVEAPSDLNDDDLRSLLAMLIEFKRASNERHATENVEYLLTSVLRFLNEPGHVLLIARDEGHIAGFMAAFTTQMAFSPDLVAMESGWYVAPEYQRSGIGGALLSAFTEWANKQGAVAKYIYPTAGLAPKSLERYLQIQGFETLGIVARQR